MSDPGLYIGRPVRVFWEDEDEWFEGNVDSYNPDKGYHIQYFDGEDEWLKNFDTNVEFTDGKGNDLDINKSQMNDQENDDLHRSGSSSSDESEEIHISGVHSPDPRNITAVLNILDDDNDDDINDELMVHAPEEEVPDRGVVLTGQVFGALNLPSVEEDEHDGRVFFRVLYVEGGSKSTMFQCKTAIFKSDLAMDLFGPEWDEGSFRFEMVLPEDQVIEALQGEILIAVYRNRAKGGSDFIGQASFPLQELRNGGKAFHQHNGVEVRSVSGSYPLIGRQGNIVGDHANAEVEVDLKLVWQAEPERTPHSLSPSKGRPGSRTPSRIRSGASVATKSQVGARRTTGGRSSSAGPAGRPTAPRGHSAVRRKKQEYLIEQENERMRKRLQQHDPKGKGKKVESSASVVYGAPVKERRDEGALFRRRSSVLPPPASVAAPKQLAKECKCTADDPDAKATYRLHNDLTETLMGLRDEVGQIQKTVQTLRLKASRSRTQVGKYEFASERLRSSQLTSGPKSDQPTTDSKAEDKEAGRHAVNKGRAKATEEQRSKKAAAPPTNDQPQAKDGVQPVRVISCITLYTPGKDPRDGAGTGSGNAAGAVGAAATPADAIEYEDRELRSMVGEHEALQEVRRTLLRRIHTAQTKVGEIEAQTGVVRDAISVVHERMEDPGESVSARTGKQRKSNKDSSNSKDNPMRRLQEARIELSTLKLLETHGIYLGPIQEELEEVRGAVIAFRNLLDISKEEHDRLAYERDLWKEKLQGLSEDSPLVRLRSALAKMRALVARHKRRVALEDITTAIHSTDIELNRYEYKSKP